MADSTERVETMFVAAEERIAGFDKIDHEVGAVTPGQMGWVEQLTTAECALRAAIGTQSWDTAAEALVYLNRANKDIWARIKAEAKAKKAREGR